MRLHTHIAAGLGTLACGIVLASCGSEEGTTTSAASAPDGGEITTAPNASGDTLPQGSDPVELDPADFTTEIDNPYWPMTPGSKWVYRESDTEGTEQKVVVEVTDEIKKIANGIDARVVRDVVTEGGEPVEVTDDWYAQDSQGNIWYLGEDTAEYENGKVSTRAGSFEAGVDGAFPGIIMPANPEAGLAYRQEYYEGEAEDEASVVSVGVEQVQVPAGRYTDVVMTRDLVPLEPKVHEFKFFARDVGPVMAIGVSGGAPGFEELQSYTPGA